MHLRVHVILNSPARPVLANGALQQDILTIILSSAYITIKVNKSFVQVKESVQLTWF